MPLRLSRPLGPHLGLAQACVQPAPAVNGTACPFPPSGLRSGLALPAGNRASFGLQARKPSRRWAPRHPRLRPSSAGKEPCHSFGPAVTSPNLGKPFPFPQRPSTAPASPPWAICRPHPCKASTGHPCAVFGHGLRTVWPTPSTGCAPAPKRKAGRNGLQRPAESLSPAEEGSPSCSEP